MSTQSNVIPESSLRSQGIAAMAIPAARLMYWSVRRELWENRAIYVAPVAVACVFLFGFSISILHLLVEMHAAPWLDAMQQRELFGQPYEFAEDLIMAAALIVGLFYSVDALYGERRDRSILFWKSLPVSDLTTVLSKAAIPIVILPLLAFAITVLTQWIMLLISSAVLAGKRSKRIDPLVAGGDLPPLAHAALPFPLHSRALAIANLCLALADFRLGTARTDSLGCVAAADHRHRGESCLQHHLFRFVDWQPLHWRLRRHRDHGTWQANGSHHALWTAPFPDQSGFVDWPGDHRGLSRCSHSHAPLSRSHLIRTPASFHLDDLIQSQGGPMESLVSVNCSQPAHLQFPLADGFDLARHTSAGSNRRAYGCHELHRTLDHM